ncbi:MAG: hypothetical protein ACKV0T_31415 [Planctomycetales bacterium]
MDDADLELERYVPVPKVDAIDGENSGQFCFDNPSADEVMRALPDDTQGGLPFIAETTRTNVRYVVEPIDDSVGKCQFYPMVGPARLHKCRYKCTVYFDKIIKGDWPVRFSHTDTVIEVVYINHDHLIRCSGESGGH